MLPEPYLREPRYRNYYNEAYGFKILDNGEAEGMRMHPNELMKMATDLGADEVVVPDYLGDADKTIELALSFRKTMRKNPGFKFMAVAQGTKYVDYLKCLRSFADTESITTVGLPRNMCRTVGSKWARIAFIEMIVKEKFDERFEFHALGATPWMREAVCLSELPVRSIDTSLPFVMALDKRSIQTDEYIERQPDFFVREPNHYERELCLGNLATYRDWARDFFESPQTSVSAV